MEDAPCKNCVLLAMCKNKYKYFVLDLLYIECSALRIYISQDDKMLLSSVFYKIADKKSLIARLNSIKKYIPNTAHWFFSEEKGLQIYSGMED